MKRIIPEPPPLSRSDSDHMSQKRAIRAGAKCKGKMISKKRPVQRLAKSTDSWYVWCGVGGSGEDPGLHLSSLNEGRDKEEMAWCVCVWRDRDEWRIMTSWKKLEKEEN